MPAAARSETRHTFCRICEALCGLEVTLADGAISQIRPDPEHVATRGLGCMKGLEQHELFSSPDRLRHPGKRVDGELVRVSWDQAIAEIGAKVKEIQARFSPDAIAMYVGTAAGFGVLHPIFAQGFMTGLGSKSMYASATQDCSNKFAVARQVYGFPFTQPFPDVDHTQCLIIVGANPVVSKWSFLQVSNPTERLREIQQRGGRVIVVDPRRTETAKVASEHVFIRPGTDVFFFLSFLQEMFAAGGVDRAQAARFMTGAEEVECLVATWTPERTAEVTGIAPVKLREVVSAHRSARGAALYCSTGVNMGGHGSLAFWLMECINALSGILADEILTPGPKQVRALFGSRVAQRLLQAAKWLHSARRRGRQPEIPQELLLSLLLRATGNGGFAKLLAEPHGRLRPDHRESDFLGQRVVTDDGRVHLAPPQLVDAASKLDAAFDRERATAGRLRLITRRQVATHNSWAHDFEDFVAGDRGTNRLYMHPQDAARAGLAAGDFADVSSETATVRVPVRTLFELMPGTVALPHGWGHQRATGLSVAGRTRGVNVNLLAADGPDAIERISGMARLTGIPVDVRPAAGPQATGSWSGLPEA